MGTVGSIAALKLVLHYFPFPHNISHGNLGKRNQHHKDLFFLPLMNPHLVQDLYLLLETRILLPNSEPNSMWRKMKSPPHLNLGALECCEWAKVLSF